MNAGNVQAVDTSSEAATHDSLEGKALGMHHPMRHALKVRLNVWHRSLPTVTRDIRMPPVPIEPRFQR